MDAELREFQHKLRRSGQNFSVVSDEVVATTLSFLKEEVALRVTARRYYVFTDKDARVYDERIKEIKTIIALWEEKDG